MIPMYFGEKDRPLFGVYHHPEKGVGAHAVLIACPVGHEYVRVHRMVRNLAVDLSRKGFPTFRFDFTGTGDSHGEADQGNLDVWRRDLVLAAEELKDTSGCREITVVGIRLGATVAAMVERYPCPVESIILWDPVLEGKSHIEELTRQHRAWLGDPQENGGPTELLGSAISPVLLQELRELTLQSMPLTSEVPFVLAASQDLSQGGALVDRLKGHGNPIESLLVSDKYGWEDPQAVETLIMAPNMVKKLMERIGAA